jgi:PilZ domain
MQNINRRESPRIDIKLRCHITSPALWAHGAMHTENISRSGILIAWGISETSLPAVGQILTLEIELPVNHSFGQKCIHCQGVVSRVSRPDNDNPRVALQVNYMDFRSFHDELRSIERLRPAADSRMA